MDQIIWNMFDNFTPQKWSCARHVIDFNQKLVEHLDKDQIWPMWIFKGRKITLLKVKDEKSYFTKCEGYFERFSQINIFPYIYTIFC